MSINAWKLDAVHSIDFANSIEMKWKYKTNTHSIQSNKLISMDSIIIREGGGGPNSKYTLPQKTMCTSYILYLILASSQVCLCMCVCVWSIRISEVTSCKTLSKRHNENSGFIRDPAMHVLRHAEASPMQFWVYLFVCMCVCKLWFADLCAFEMIMKIKDTFMLQRIHQWSQDVWNRFLNVHSRNAFGTRTLWKFGFFVCSNNNR